MSSPNGFGAGGGVHPGLQGVQFDTPEGYASQAAALAPPTPKTPPAGWAPPTTPKPAVNDAPMMQNAYTQNTLGGGHYGGIIPQSMQSSQLVPQNPWSTLFPGMGNNANPHQMLGGPFSIWPGIW